MSKSVKILTPEQIKENYHEFFRRVNKFFPERSEQLIKMYKDIGLDRLGMSPASSVEHLHNAFPGGYIDHVLRVMDFSVAEYNHAKKLGIDVSGFDPRELLFAAAHHDLGKVGLNGDGNELYQPNDSEWHRKNMGKLYKINENLPFSLVPDRSLYLLQLYGVKCTWNEWIAIKIHDGLFDEVNKPYYIGFNVHTKQRTFMYQILHNADMYASRFEFERWNKLTNSLRTSPVNTVSELYNEVEETSNDESNEENNAESKFNETFGEE